jgi:hypothetical protein
MWVRLFNSENFVLAVCNVSLKVGKGGDGAVSVCANVPWHRVSLSQ